MHDTAMQIGELFFSTYGKDSWRIVIELGSLDINGSLRTLSPINSVYIGADSEFGKSVDLKIDIHRGLPFRDEFADCVISSSQMEHDDFFWNTFLNIVKITKTGGFIYINAPSNGFYHRYPNDNWRFYPDCGHVFVRWAQVNGIEVQLVESFIADKANDIWNDFVAVFVKGKLDAAPTRFIADQVACRNVWKWQASTPEKLSSLSQDEEIIRNLKFLSIRLEEDPAKINAHEHIDRDASILKSS